MNPEILKEEKDYVIINKPAGLVVHADGKTDEKTLADWILEKYPETENVGELLTLNNGKVISRPGIVHRLDCDTSGVMVIARTRSGFEYLKQQFQDRKVEKTYHTFVYGNIKEETFVVNKPIGRSKKDFRQWFAGFGARGKNREAVTEFKVLKRSSNKSVTFIEAKPKTGRTHQIRVHLKSVYHPIICDSLYAPNRECLLQFDRLALHSYNIAFTDPNGNEVSVGAGYPVDFKRALNQGLTWVA